METPMYTLAVAVSNASAARTAPLAPDAAGFLPLEILLGPMLRPNLLLTNRLH